MAERHPELKHPRLVGLLTKIALTLVAKGISRCGFAAYRYIPVLRKVGGLEKDMCCSEKKANTGASWMHLSRVPMLVTPCTLFDFAKAEDDDRCAQRGAAQPRAAALCKFWAGWAREGLRSCRS